MNYLFSLSLPYEFPILRPLQAVLCDRGDRVAWFCDNPAAAAYLREEEQVMHTVREVMAYDPAAVFSAGNLTYPFFPGVKVQLFHGLNIDKRADNGAEHFRIRGLYDLYCTHGPTSTPRFEELAARKKYFAVAETGWPKIDNYFPNGLNASHIRRHGEPLRVLYASTFTERITSTGHLYGQIEQLIRERDWHWTITLHPLTKPETIERYRSLERHPNVTFYMGDDNTGIVREADVMVCDSSSIIVEFLSMDKPVVTFRNTIGGDHLIDIQQPEQLEAAIELAATHPSELMAAIRTYMAQIHPHQDGRCSERVAQALDAFIAMGGRELLQPKPLNLVRRWQLRRKIRHLR